MSSGRSSQSGSADPPNPGCDGAITRRSLASRPTNGSSGLNPPAPCRKSTGGPSPPSHSSRSTPASVILRMDVRLPSGCADSTAIGAGEEADAHGQNTTVNDPGHLDPDTLSGCEPAERQRRSA